MKRTLNMPPLTNMEKARIEEVKFFLFISKLMRIARSTGSEDELALFRNCIEITQCNETLLTVAANNILVLANKPQEIEVAVAAKYMEYPYRFVEKRLMHSRKFYKLINEYLENREVNTLYPRLGELTNEIALFNRKVREVICPIFDYLDCDFTEVSEGWNS